MKLDLKKIKIGETIKIFDTMKKDEFIRHKIVDKHHAGKIVKNIRKRKKKTQMDIAKYSNLSRLVVSEFENGKSDIKLSTLLKILKSCDLQLEISEK